MRPVIHFAHANGLPSATYRKMLDALASHYHIQAIPVLGHNPDFPVNNNWEFLTQELINHIESVAQRPVVGVGHSLGGALTLRAAFSRPDLFEQIILLDVPALTFTDSVIVNALKRLRLMDQVTPAKKSKHRRTHWPDKKSAFDYFQSRKLFAEFDEDCLRDYVESGLIDSEGGGVELRYRLGVELAVFRTLPHRPIYRRASLKVPVGVLVGRQSDTVRKYQYLRMKRTLGFLAKRIPGSHMFPLEYPIDTAQEIHHMQMQLRRNQ